ncbi:hypothetical protein JD969_10040 [Planctomycetota bacterium]|nr:hypothetical protein JD969_10040 [Planctomycetota bacterium]
MFYQSIKNKHTRHWLKSLPKDEAKAIKYIFNARIIDKSFSHARLRKFLTSFSVYLFSIVILATLTTAMQQIITVPQAIFVMILSLFILIVVLYLLNHEHSDQLHAQTISSILNQRRYPLTTCPICGYDIHHLTQGSCPECGTYYRGITNDPELQKQISLNIAHENNAIKANTKATLIYFNILNITASMTFGLTFASTMIFKSTLFNIAFIFIAPTLFLIAPMVLKHQAKKFHHYSTERWENHDKQFR